MLLICGTFIFLLLALLLPSSARVLPEPQADNRIFKVASAHISLTDPGRRDPYNDAYERKVMLTLFVPVNVTACEEYVSSIYMPPETARISNAQFFGDANAGVFNSLSYQSCSRSDLSIRTANLGIVLLEPAVNTSRLLYAQLGRQIASTGAVVALLDHPHDASIVEFPDPHNGRYTTSPPIYGATALSPHGPMLPWNATISKALNTRVTDIDFILEHLASASLLATHFPGLNFDGPLHTQLYSIIGHGLGGSVATWKAAIDPRVRFSIAMGGSPPLIHDTIAPPIVFFGREGATRALDAHWVEAWRHVRRATEFDLRGGVAMDFSDLPFVARGGERTFHVVACFASAYVRREMQGDQRQVEECVQRFPEMVPYPGAVGGS